MYGKATAESAKVRARDRVLPPARIREISAYARAVCTLPPADRRKPGNEERSNP